MGRTRETANLVSEGLITRDVDTDRVGINSITPDSLLDVRGTITGTDYSGDGSALSGIVTSIVAGTNITLTGGPIGIVTINSSGGGGGSNPWTRKTTSYTSAAGDQLIADTSGGVYTITLPASPSEGDSIKIGDGGDWETNNLTVARNGSNIEGSADDFILNLKGIIVEFVYEDSTDGWQVYSYTGIGGGVVVQEEGTNVGTAVTTINFVGSTLTATVSSNIATITSSGSGGGGADILESMLFA